MFNDRIEVISPGGLPRGITEEEYINGQFSSLRNPIIADVFFRLKMIEKFGTGILRIRELYKDAAIKPQFTVYDNSITVILPVMVQIVITDEERLVLTYIENNGLVSRQDIQKSLDMERTKTIDILNSLLSKEKIIVQGRAKATKYMVNIR